MAAWAARNAADQRSLRQRSSFQPNSLEDASPTSTRAATASNRRVRHRRQRQPL